MAHWNHNDREIILISLLIYIIIGIDLFKLGQNSLLYPGPIGGWFESRPLTGNNFFSLYSLKDMVTT